RDGELDDLEAMLFGEAPKSILPSFSLESAFQGQEALAMVQEAKKKGSGYSLVFMDVRMPPGWDGVKTTAEVLRADPEVLVVICTAYSDYSWEEMSESIGNSDRVLILKKPFDVMEVRQLASALHRRWQLGREVAQRMEDLEARVLQRTHELEESNRELRASALAREAMEVELRLAQKLEAVGQLAAGIAHEINTPMQFVSDNVSFLREATSDMQNLVKKYREIIRDTLDAAAYASLDPLLTNAEEAFDLEYLQEHLAPAFRQATDGISRVSEIVLSMKRFSHPDRREKAPVDLNEAARDTAIVARNEYKYVAELELELGDIRPVMGHRGDLCQVLLNLVVNAAHAVGDGIGPEERGRITVRTAMDGDGYVLLTVSDSGTGIPKEVRERVFDPFFTTKEVGKGTGQGLAIARTVVVDDHGGTISVDSEPGEGTTFHVRLPIEASAEAAKERVQS
ncbi:MAG: ATP-binding protein, partial [Myxococcales bacterium]|nr:ATP-binding protein [Myxococcales bacterium]